MGTAIDPSEIKRFEITEVYSHPDAKVDIVLVHGLNGDPRATWTAKNGIFWPSQLLPVSLKSARARVLVYGYNADVYAFGSKNSASSDMIHLHAQSLVSGLSLERKSEETTSNPIIWVAHSLGGILVKRALELSNDLTSKSADDNRNIFVSTYGVIFLGTPHTGADPAKWGIILQGMVGTLVPKKIMDSEPHLVKTLQTNNETLQNINLHFLDIYQRFKICMVHEAMKTDLKGSRSFIVDQISASPLLPDVQYFGIEATHSGMCKFESKNSPGYLNVSATIKGWVEESPRVIQARLDMERKTRRQADEARAKEIMGIYDSVDSQTPQGSGHQTPALSKSYHSIATIEPDTQSLDPKEPYFIKPSGFRPNSLFVGREAELAEMHRLLFDKKRRAHGTSAVLIQSMPGGGKTHLAREYVYQHKDEFPGGIFWLRAKTLPELAAGYWDIARNGALRGSNENLSLNDPEQFIKVVRNWLNQRQNWLLVLDGIHFDDTDHLIKYIPDSPNTSLIYTSTVKSVSNDYHFMNPQVIKLPLLSAKEAQTLLLLELNKGKNPSRDDLLHSMELVQAMGFLPVVIHAVAQRLKATDEPLAKFARSYSAEPKLRGLGAYTAVVDQLKMLGAIEALNLLRILCFFSQHIPVEMIVLGLNALDVPVKAFEPISGRSLNNTFKILNSFALIDRNEPEPLHSSQSSKGSRDMIGDHVDVIRLHSVVESFFVDTLLAEGTLSLWLDRAVKVFCCSYDTACERIIRKHSPGLVEDYRLYEIHGNKLREHVKRYFKKSPVLRESLLFLDHRLQIVKGEIERRTPESSQSIAGGKQEAFHISIFDRTSSSSDTDPATPGLFDKYNTEISTWGLEVEKAQIESPISIKSYDHQTPVAPSKSAFPPLRQHDIGYDSDMDESVPETVRPVQRTLQQEDSTISSEPPWETVENRRSKPKAKPVRLDLHRTVKNMEKKRYSDSLGSFRSASDPRVTHEFAHGFVHRNNSRAQSRGRISGQSQAEVALTHITTTSPPPVRGGGKIQDRRGSSGRRSQDNNRLVAGAATYAAAVTGPTRDTVSDQRQMLRPSTDSTATEYGSLDTQSSSVPSLMTSSAIQSLQRLPHEKQIPKPTRQSSPRQPPTPMPPYPRSPSPYPTYRYPYQSSETDLYKLGGGSTYSQENLRLGPDPYSSLVYPRMTGPIPYEVLSTSPRKRDLPHDYPQWDSQTYSNMAATFPSPEYHQSYPTSEQNPEFLSLSSPNIARPQYYNIREGYTSQPISRNPSDQNPPTSSSTPYNYRRPSLAETEPLPQLPTFSPMIPQAHYPSYQGTRERAVSQSTSSSNGTRRKSPRLDLAHRAALISTLEEWPDTEPLPQLVPRAQVPFNPNAPVFSPRVSRHNSPVSGGSTRRSSPAQPQAPYPTPEMGAGGVEMGRSGSGGLRVGRRMIGFGDFPELIDPQEARERVRGAWAEREATSSLTGLGIRR